MLCLFELFTLEGWPDIMWSLADATDSEHGPVENNQQFEAFVLFFVLIVFGAFFLMNLFVGVIVTAYNKAQNIDPIKDAGKEEIFHVESMGIALKESPKQRYHPDTATWRKKMVLIVISPKFEVLAMGAIVLNIFAMCVDWYGMPDQLTDTMEVISTVFTAIFTLEGFFKITALGIKQYLRDWWNCFDFVLVVTSVLEVIEVFSFNPTMIRIFRIFRLMRLMRLSRKARGLQNLGKTLVTTLPSLMHVGFLLMIFFFMYAVLGVQLFYNVKHQDAVTRQANFESFGQALYVLFRISTGEDWNLAMYEVSVQPPDCTPDFSAADGVGDCGVSRAVSVIYFGSFTLLCALTTLNLIVAVILFAFFELSEQDGSDDWVRCLTQQHFADFTEAWMTLDPEAVGKIPTESLPTLLDSIPPPLGANTNELVHAHAVKVQQQLVAQQDEGERPSSPLSTQHEMSRMLVRFESEDMATYTYSKADVQFNDVLTALVFMYTAGDPRVKAARTVQRRWREVLRTRQQAPPEDVTQYEVAPLGMVPPQLPLSPRSPRSQTNGTHGPRVPPSLEEMRLETGAPILALPSRDEPDSGGDARQAPVARDLVRGAEVDTQPSRVLPSLEAMRAATPPRSPRNTGASPTSLTSTPKQSYSPRKTTPRAMTPPKRARATTPTRNPPPISMTFDL